MNPYIFNKKRPAFTRNQLQMSWTGTLCFSMFMNTFSRANLSPRLLMKSKLYCLPSPRTHRPSEFCTWHPKTQIQSEQRLFKLVITCSMESKISSRCGETLNNKFNTYRYYVVKAVHWYFKCAMGSLQVEFTVEITFALSLKIRFISIADWTASIQKLT